MAEYPEAQRRAQEELDRVLGPPRVRHRQSPDSGELSRVAAIDDMGSLRMRADLPYVDALCKEVLRCVRLSIDYDCD